MSLLKSIQNTKNKESQQKDLTLLKKRFPQDMILLQMVENYIENKAGSIIEINKTIKNFEKIFDNSTYELERLKTILSKYYPQENKLIKGLDVYLKVLAK